MRCTTRMRSRALLIGSVLGAMALVAAACGSSTPSTSKTTTAPPVSTPGVTANQIVLGTTTPLTGPAAPGYSLIAPAANAIFQYVNAHGGIYGRKIKFDILNDQYDPTLTVSMTRQLVQADNIFATVGGLGTPTQLAVQSYLNSQKIPQLFIASGCACWSNPTTYPESFGFQPNYIVEGKILGQYVTKHFAGEKVGYLYQDDEFGMDGVKGLDQYIPKGSISGEQNYQGTAAGLAAGLGAQIDALKASGAKVVVLYTIPAATALALLAAAEVHYTPQWVVSSVGADPPTLTGLLSSFSKGAAGGVLLNGLITNAYLPPETEASNAWVKLSQSILTTYDPGYTTAKDWNGNTEYGAALGYATVELLEAAGKNLTRAGVIAALESKGATFATSGLVPFSYSSMDHYGFSGSEIVQEEDNGLKVSKLSPVYVSTNTGPITVYKGMPAPIPSLFAGG
ncbi:MAG: ABC transporter substrate-binding protein [Acidimicrobiales bacterium]